MKSCALIAWEDQHFSLEDVEIPDPAPDQIRIERKVGEKILTELRQRGHKLKIYNQMGATQATSLQNGKFGAAHDPRLKGKATTY